MFVTGLIFTILSALLHIFIFYMESFAWTGEKSRSVFGLTQDQAENTREMAFSQGFYNFFGNRSSLRLRTPAHGEHNWNRIGTFWHRFYACCSASSFCHFARQTRCSHQTGSAPITSACLPYLRFNAVTYLTVDNSQLCPILLDRWRRSRKKALSCAAASSASTPDAT